MKWLLPGPTAAAPVAAAAESSTAVVAGGTAGVHADPELAAVVLAAVQRINRVFCVALREEVN